MSPLQPNSGVAREFLRLIAPRGPIVLTAINPDGLGAPTRTFLPSELCEAIGFIERHNLDCNIYFMANRPRYRLFKRAKESDVGIVRYLALDFDPLLNEATDACKSRVRALLRTYRLPPTFVWDTGNGIQAMWRLNPVNLREIDDLNECKQRCIGLMKSLGGAKQGIDATQSVEHLFRVAGTVNHPNAAKRAKGRVSCLAGTFTMQRENAYDLSEFPISRMGFKPAVRTALIVQEEPIGGWDTTAGIRDFVLYLQTTRDLAEEGRSGTAIRTARKGRDYGVSADLALDLMLEHWVPRCEYAWEDDELTGKVTRAYVNAQNDAGCLTIEYRTAMETRDA